jgi:uncharacterized cupin superfamily protein
MPKIFNAKEISFEKRGSRIPEFLWHTSPRLAELSDAKYLQFDIRSLDPGKFSFPYHFHRAAEELFVILSGEATSAPPKDLKNYLKEMLSFSKKEPRERISFIITTILHVSTWTFGQRSVSTSVNILIQER